MVMFSIIALVILGPDKLPIALRTIARYYVKIKRFVTGIQRDLEKELNITELRQLMQEEMQRIEALESEMQQKFAEFERQHRTLSERYAITHLDLETTDQLKTTDLSATQQNFQATKMQSGSAMAHASGHFKSVKIFAVSPLKTSNVQVGLQGVPYLACYALSRLQPISSSNLNSVSVAASVSHTTDSHLREAKTIELNLLNDIHLADQGTAKQHIDHSPVNSSDQAAMSYARQLYFYNPVERTIPFIGKLEWYTHTFKSRRHDASTSHYSVAV